MLDTAGHLSLSPPTTVGHPHLQVEQLAQGHPAGGRQQKSEPSSLDSETEGGLGQTPSGPALPWALALDPRASQQRADLSFRTVK